MAKETMKAKIERVEQEKKADLERIMQLNQEIVAMQEAADQEFTNSPTKKQYEDQIQFQSDRIIVQEKRLTQEIKKNEALRDEIERLETQIGDLKAQKQKVAQRFTMSEMPAERLKLTKK